MTCSAEQLVYGNEVIGMIKQFMKGIPVNRETLAREVIEAVGPGGHYLTRKHTLDHFRDVFWKPGLMNRMTREQWEEEGSKEMSQVVKEETLHIMETHRPEPLDGKVLEELTRIRKRGEKELLSY